VGSQSSQVMFIIAQQCVIPVVTSSVRKGHSLGQSPAERLSGTQPVGRRLVGGGALAAALLSLAQRAQAYGGSGNIRSTDSGSGNPRYEDLVAGIKSRGEGVLAITDKPGVTAPPAKGKCLTGREPACK